MTWTKLGAEFPAEARNLSHEAFRLHVETLCYANHLLCDLTLSVAEVRRGTWLDEIDRPMRELVEAGWWERLPDGRLFVSARFPGWQQTRDTVERRRATNLKAQRARRERQKDMSAADTAHDSSAESALLSERNGTVEKGKPTLSVVEWPEVKRCAVCHGVLDPKLGMTSHPTCVAS